MLDATPKALYKREALRINPAKTCQPVGAMYAALGIHRCLPHSHGSQGCCSYHRSVLSRMYKEPAMASTSSFTEGTSVFGGGQNLKTAVKNIFSLYDPDIIAVHTTCLSETIGDDLPAFIRDIEVPDGKMIIHANTPSYQGSHVTGFSSMVKSMVGYLSKNSGISNGKVNVIPGFVSPADIREIKRIFKLMDAPLIIFPDTSGVFDAPTLDGFDMYPKGGTKIEEIIDAGNSEFTISLGKYASEAGAIEMEKTCKVPFKTLKAPIGIGATDELITTISRITGKDIPYEIEEERGQLIDLLLDSHQYFYGKKVAIAGDPDLVISLTQFVIELGMIPKYVITGTPWEEFERTIKSILDNSKIAGGFVKASSDLFELHQLIKNESVDLLLSGSYGKYIARAENIPIVRFGFPILDRYGHQYIQDYGYKGAIELIIKISNAFLEKLDSECLEEDFEAIR